MWIVLMLIIGGIGAGFVVQYFIMSLHHKKHEKDKKQISEELVALLKE